MAKAKFVRTNSVLRTAAKALQRSISWQQPWAAAVPEDVKEGQFAVVAVWGDEATRFVVPLRCLSHPLFLRLLELAAEEFGFENAGALAVPCCPSVLESIIRETSAAAAGEE